MTKAVQRKGSFTLRDTLVITNSEIEPPVDPDRIYEYRVDGGRVKSTGTEIINDAEKLQEIALESIQPYSDLIACIRFQEPWKSFKDRIVGDLFFLTDISTKRNEYYESFDAFCGAQLIKEKIKNQKISKVIVVGTSIFRADTIRSLAPSASIKFLNQRSFFPTWMEVFVKNILFCIKLFIISILIPFIIRPTFNATGAKRFFVTRFPGRLGTDEREQKYNDLVRPEDYFIASVLTDGLHQNPSVFRWAKLIADTRSLKRTIIVDRFFNPALAFQCLANTSYLLSQRWKDRRQYIFEGLDFSEIINEEITRSLIRTPRLVAISRGFKQAFGDLEKKNPRSSVIYYLHEYAYGRMLTAVLKKHCSSLTRIGFQHGPSSRTKLIYSLSKYDFVGEVDNLALPHAVLAEDIFSANLYRTNGYKKVTTLSDIPRLKSVHNKKSSITTGPRTTSLIATGLHDGLDVVTMMLPVIREMAEQNFIIKLHPKANNKAILAVKLPANCKFVSEPVGHLFPFVERVYSTYSSVGAEAESVGIPVEYIVTPGRVSQKPSK